MEGRPVLCFEDGRHKRRFAKLAPVSEACHSEPVELDIMKDCIFDEPDHVAGNVTLRLRQGDRFCVIMHNRYTYCKKHNGTY